MISTGCGRSSKHAQALNVSDRSVRHILHSDLSLHTYKLQVVHALSNQDREMRLQFCHQFVGILTDNPHLLNELLMSDEAHFHLHGTVNNLNLPPNNGTLWFQQDGATAHMAVISIAALHHLFPQWVISRFSYVPWPHSLDLTAPDFFLRAYLKSKVYSNHPTDLHTFKENIQEEIARLAEQTLQAVMRSFLTRVHLCIEEGGGHLKNIIHKK